MIKFPSLSPYALTLLFFCLLFNPVKGAANTEPEMSSWGKAKLAYPYSSQQNAQRSADSQPDFLKRTNRTIVNLRPSDKAPTSIDQHNYTWTILKKPYVSTSKISSKNDRETSFLLDALGEFIFELTISGGDRPYVETVAIESAAEVEYTLSEIESDFSARNIDDIPAAMAYGVDKKLNFFQLDYLLSEPIGTTYDFALNNDDPSLAWPDGGAVFNGADITFELTEMLEVPYDFSDIEYPDDYKTANASSISATNPICEPPSDKTLIPAEYMGKVSLPNIHVDDVGQQNIRMVRMKDVWDTRQGNYVVGCINDIRAIFLQTLTRLKALGVNAIAFTPWQWFDGRQDTWRVMSAEESNSVAMSDRELAWAASEAKRQGFLTFWASQVQGVVVLDEEGQETMLFGQTDDPELIRKTFNALDDWFLERGEFLERINVDGVLLPNWYWTGLSGVLDASEYAERTAKNLTNLKTHFSGQVAMDADASLFSSSEASELIDYYLGSVYISESIPEEEVATWTVDDFKEALSPSLMNIKGANKPVLWDVGVASRTNALDLGYVEETFCNATTSGIDGFSTECIQKDMPTDFSFQATYIQAALELLSEQTNEANFPSHGGIIGQYWMDDNILASTTFPNIAYSMRSKPAEYVFYKWFEPYRELTMIKGSLSGSWYDKNRDGEGFVFEFAENKDSSIALVYWFTHRDGVPYWLYGTTELKEDSFNRSGVLTFELAEVSGTGFGQRFEPSDLQETPRGLLEVTFGACNQSNAVYTPNQASFDLASEPTSFELERITSGLDSVPCSNGLMLPKTTNLGYVTMQGAMTGSWFDSSRNGEGFVFEFGKTDSTNMATVYWFTHRNGSPYWMIGTAPYQGDDSMTVELLEVSGTGFGEQFLSDDLMIENQGEAKFIFSDCDKASVEWAGPSSESGSLSIERITPNLQDAPCLP